MYKQKRDAITRGYLISLIQNVSTYVESSSDNQPAKMLDRWLGNDEKQKIIAEFLAYAKELEANQESDLYNQYFKFLSQVRFLKQNVSEPLRKKLQGTLIQELSSLEEIEWQNNGDNDENIERALIQLSNAVLYESPEHFQFSKKWNVAESKSHFPVWLNFVDKILDENSDLRKGYLGKVVSDLCCEYGIHHPGFADTKNVEINQIISDINIDEHAGEHTHVPENQSKSIFDLQDELPIWTPANIAYVFTLYMRNSLPIIDDVDSTKKKISHFVIAPLIRSFVNEVRDKCNKTRYDENDISKAQIQFSKAVDAMVREMKLAQNPQSKVEENPVNRTATIPAKPIVETPAVVSPNKKESQPAPSYTRSKPDWGLLGSIVAGMLVGSLITMAIMLSMGTGAPLAFGAFLLTLFHVTATTHITTWLGGSLLVALPVLGAVTGWFGDLLIRSCRGVASMRDFVCSKKNNGNDSAYINKKLATNANQIKPSASPELTSVESVDKKSPVTIRKNTSAPQVQLFAPDYIQTVPVVPVEEIRTSPGFSKR